MRPDLKGKNVIIGMRYSGLLTAPLEALGFNVIGLPDNPDVDSRLAGHADLSVFYDGQYDFFLAKYLQGSFLHEYLSSRGFIVHISQINQGKKYPADVPLNVFLRDDSFIFNPDTIDKDIAAFLLSQGRKAVQCRQGYPACCILRAGKGIITSDNGICSSASESGIEVLKITPGFIDLKGYDYGFIGGSVIRLGESMLAFTGRIDLHPDADIIVNYLTNNGVTPVFLTEHNAFDIGGGVVF